MICSVIEPHGVQETACTAFIQIACHCFVSQHVQDCNCMLDWVAFVQKWGGYVEDLGREWKL